jgi:hypothetical protein
MLSVFMQPPASGPGRDQLDNVDADLPSPAARRTDANRREHMPLCPGGCAGAAIAVAHTASAVRDLGVASAFSTAAASALGIGYKRGLFDAPAARSAASELTEQSAAAVGAGRALEGGDRGRRGRPPGRNTPAA